MIRTVTTSRRSKSQGSRSWLSSVQRYRDRFRACCVPNIGAAHVLKPCCARCSAGRAECSKGTWGGGLAGLRLGAGLAMEPLEARQLLTATYLVNDNWHDINLGTLSVGDPVISSNDPSNPGVTGTYGVDAFGSTDSPSGPTSLAGSSLINNAIAAAAPGDTVSVITGTYPENVILNKQLIFKGAEFGVDARPRCGGAESCIRIHYRAEHLDGRWNCKTPRIILRLTDLQLSPRRVAAEPSNRRQVKPINCNSGTIMSPLRLASRRRHSF